MNTSYKRVDRMKDIMKWEGITQEQLGEIIGGQEGGTVIKQQNISRAFRSGQIKEEWWQAVVAQYPQYRIAWLLGYDDQPTNTDVLAAAQNEAEDLEKAFALLFDLAGYDVIRAKGDGSLQGIFKAMRTAVTLRKGYKSVTMSLADLNAFENEILDYISFRLEHL